MALRVPVGDALALLAALAVGALIDLPPPAHVQDLTGFEGLLDDP